MTAAKSFDPTIYPDSDGMGEGELQLLIDELFRPLLARFLAARGRVAHVGSNTFIYYKQFDSSSRIAPDIYVFPGIPQARISRTWKLWELDARLCFALEVVSVDWMKDYFETPAIHSHIGTRELIVFDPEGPKRRDRVRWQVFQRVGSRLQRVENSQGDRVRSKELGCFLRVEGAGDAQRLRIGVGPSGRSLFPTEAEAERAEKERERAEKERERAEKEREAKARRALMRENARLKRELSRLGRRAKK